MKGNMSSYAVPLPTEPGLGVEIDESWLIAATEEGSAAADALTKLDTAPSDNVKRGQFLRRRDGSYTNSK
jgi:hypothetical protein|eukprot:COSAG01_NODE_19650_length_998_cov_1.050056_2_plen_70_part_00